MPQSHSLDLGKKRGLISIMVYTIGILATIVSRVAKIFSKQPLMTFSRGTRGCGCGDI